jgi:hypothetical protein
MRVITHLGVLVLIVAQVCAQGIKQSGVVSDKQSGAKIAGAIVSAAGGQATQEVVTDSNGLFILPLADGIKSGQTIRIRVQKTGYHTYDEQWPVSVEVFLQIGLEPLKKAHESAGPKVPAQPAAIVSPPPIPSDNVRNQGLALSNEILDFLAERQRNDPQETRVLFEDKFESKIADIHDEFASRGLHDSTLDLIYRYPGYDMVGNNVDAAISDISRIIHKLSLLIPPAGLYKDVSDAQLAQMAIDEANKMDEKLDEEKQRLDTSPSRDAERFFFFTDFRSCCLDQVEYLRAEMMKRLGPSANDTDEMMDFSGVDGLTEIEKNQSGSIGTVLTYSPRFRRLAIKMKRKAAPLPRPTALTYRETQVASEKPIVPYKMVVTIETKTDLLSGYVLLQFIGQHASVWWDFADAKDILDGHDVIDDPELERLLQRNPTMSVLALKIGRTPFLSSRPINVVVEAFEQIHVAKVLFFDE